MLRYAQQLSQIGAHVGVIVNSFKLDDPNDTSAIPRLERVLRTYSDALTGWARETGANMLLAVNQRDYKTWVANTKHLSAGIRQEIRHADVGVRMRELLEQQVHLIRSIPLDAARRVHELSLQALEMSTRPAEVAAEIARSGQVSKSKAMLIARTETGRAATVLTQARAESIGSEGYIWRSARDQQVRPSHRRMEGKFVDWRQPPTLDNLTGHAGALPNCRCYPESVIPEL